VSSPPAESTLVGVTTSCSTSKSTRISTFLRSHRPCRRAPLSHSRTSQTTNGNRFLQRPPPTTLPTRPLHHRHINIERVLQAWACL
jgi:hypothetical protein